MLSLSVDDIRARAETLAAGLDGRPGWRATLTPGTSAVGGGSAPGVELPTVLVAIERDGLSPDALDARLRTLVPPVIARIDRHRIVLDLRSVLPHEDAHLLAALQHLT